MATKSANQRFINKTSDSDDTALQEFGLASKQTASSYRNNDETLLRGHFWDTLKRNW